jgi:hypothetical protein
MNLTMDLKTTSVAICPLIDLQIDSFEISLHFSSEFAFDISNEIYTLVEIHFFIFYLSVLSLSTRRIIDFTDFNQQPRCRFRGESN